MPCQAMRCDVMRCATYLRYIIHRHLSIIWAYYTYSTKPLARYIHIRQSLHAANNLGTFVTTLVKRSVRHVGGEPPISSHSLYDIAFDWVHISWATLELCDVDRV